MRFRRQLATIPFLAFVLASALAVAAAPPYTATARLEDPRPWDGENGIEAASRLVEQDGTLTITGTATGLESGVLYLSLVYDKGSQPKGPNACEPSLPVGHPLGIVDTMFVGFWVVDEDGNGLLMAGPNGSPLDRVGAMSIRDTRINGGFGPEAVIACGRVVPER